MRIPVVIRSNSQFRKERQALKKGDVVACMLNLKPFEEYVFTDLAHKGVTLVPSALAQLASRSKCFQAYLMADLMVPHTKIIRGKRDLVMAIEEYSRLGIGPVITKQDRSDCGLGINRWNSCEELFNQVVFSDSPPWPFVMQPFIPDSLDIRVVWIGNKHLEAYWRRNPFSFRNNLHFGGETGRHELDDTERQLCSRAMEQGAFPYAHIDLLKESSGKVYLSEISLNGGTKGATIDSAKCARLKRELEEEIVESLLTENKGGG
ncbi:MAG: hypothetical protein GXO58_08775 [Thermodesulfobacteria bacterium]|nr:hypothetical protein [Thermodesulfobacteriota bacterium]